MQQQPYDTIAINYDEMMRRSPYYRNVRTLEKRTLIDLLKVRDFKNMLDIGGGTGFASIIGAQNGLSVCTVDPSAEMLRIAKSTLESYPVEKTFIKAKAEDLPDLGKTFDLVVAFGSVINHSDDWGAFFQRLATHSRPGSRILITFDNLLGVDSWSWGLFSALRGYRPGVSDLIKRIKASIGRSDHVNEWLLMADNVSTGVHLRYGSWKQAARILREKGFQITRCQGTNCFAALSRSILLSSQGTTEIRTMGTTTGGLLSSLDERLGQKLWRVCGNYVVEAIRS